MKIIITGGTRGFGLAYANILQGKGNEVIKVASKNSDVNIDLTKREGTLTLINLIEMVNPEMVILNAGFGGTKPFDQYTDDDLINMQYINGVNKALVIKHFYKQIKSGEMKFIVASSIAGKVPSPLMASYSASKAYISNLIDSVNGELFAQGIDNLITDATPGNVNTKTQTQEVIDYANKVLESNGGFVFNNDVYYKVMLKPHNDWNKFVKNSYEKKFERMNAKK